MINDRKFLHDVANVVKTTCYISSAFSTIPSVKWSNDDGQGIWQMKRESMLCFVKRNFFYRLVNRYTSTLWTFYERGSVKTNTISRILTKSFKHLLCCVPLSILLARVMLRVHASWRFNAAFGCQSGAPALRFALFLSHLLPFFLSFPRGRPIRRKTVSLTADYATREQAQEETDSGYVQSIYHVVEKVVRFVENISGKRWR